MATKHIGRLSTNNRKVIVAYRVVPDEPDSAVVVTTENLMADEHDSLIQLVESPAGQEAYELGEAMARSVLPDGRNMLAAFHTTGKMVKVPTSIVTMTPDMKTTIPLSELNEMIAQQKGVTVEELAISDKQSANQKRKADAKTALAKEAEVTELATVTDLQAPTDRVLSDDELAANYRSQADRLFKEAKALREQAEALAPTKKKTASKTSG